MLRRFQAMKRVKAQPVLPQSESGSDADDGVHRGYTSALLQVRLSACRKHI